MSTAHLYTRYRPGLAWCGAPTISFELYPPRADASASVWMGVDRLISSAPDFVSVTYGASGSDGRASSEVLRKVGQTSNIPAMGHLTCAGASKAELSQIISDLLRAGLRDFLALRGDPPAGQREWVNHPDGLNRGVELVRLIREVAATQLPQGVGKLAGGAGIASCENPADYVSIAVACYPAARGQARRNDVAALLEKQQAGADYAITQIFYEAEDYASLVREATIFGVRIPILPGLMPLTDIGRLHRLEQLTAVAVPQWLSELLNNPDGRERVSAGLAATINLVDEVLSAGAPGMHIYTFNRARPSLDLVEYVRAGGYLEAGGKQKHTSSHLLPVGSAAGDALGSTQIRVGADSCPSDMPPFARIPRRQVDIDLVDLALNRLTP